LTLDQELSRKIRITPECLKFSGRAGDLSKRSGTQKRLEEERAFYCRTVDSPTIARFAAGMAQNACNVPLAPSEAEQRQAEEVAAAKLDVAALDKWPGGRDSIGVGQHV
jgi:hypothetical protein